MSGGNRLWHIAWLLLVALMTGSCTMSKKVGQVLMNPDIQVGSLADQPSTLHMTLLAEPDINKNESDEAAPVRLEVVYLSEDSKLLELDFDQLNEEKSDLSGLLGKNYIDHQEYTLSPGQFKPLKPIRLEEKNQYIGVIAYFSDENSSEWKKTIKASGSGHVYHLLVHVKAGNVELQKEED